MLSRFTEQKFILTQNIIEHLNIEVYLHSKHHRTFTSKHEHNVRKYRHNVHVVGYIDLYKSLIIELQLIMENKVCIYHH